MGSRYSTRSSNREEENTENAESIKKSASVESEASTRHLLELVVKRFLRKSLLSPSHYKLEIKGHVERYPFWLSASDFKTDHDDFKPINYYKLLPDKTLIACAPRLPNSLHCQTNRTIKLSLSYKTSSISDYKQDRLPEHDVLIHAVTKIFLHINIRNGSEGRPKINIDVYEHHRAPRGSRRIDLSLRQMKVQRVVFDQSSNMAIIGQEWALIVHQGNIDQERVVEDERMIKGIYIRALDTSPSSTITFQHRQVGYVEDLTIPSSVTCSSEYAQTLLNTKSYAKNRFKVKLSRSR